MNNEKAAKTEPHKMEATVFVYRHKRTRRTQAHYIEVARILEDDPEWEHLATLEPRMWIEHNYDAAEQRDELLAALEKLTDVFANIGITSGLYDDEQDALKAACDVLARVKGGAA